MPTLAQLKADDLSLGANVDLGKAVAALLAMPTVTLPAQDIQWSAIRSILMNNWDWGTLVACTMLPGATAICPGGTLVTKEIKVAADAIREACLYGDSLRASDPTVWGNLTASASLLTPPNVKGLSSASVTAVTALRTPTVVKWAGVDAGMLQLARSQP